MKNKGYFNKEYDSKARFCSYWHQIREIMDLEPKNVLEIGIGNSFVSDYLKKREIKITTFDKHKHLNPDIIGDVLNLPFKENSFDVVSCCELLEHLPYEDFKKVLKEMHGVSSSYVVISLPDFKYANQKSKYHFWEVDFEDYTLKKIIKEIKNSGFKINKTYNVPENLYHKFFVLEK